jgi:hypothetical protein
MPGQPQFPTGPRLFCHLATTYLGVKYKFRGRPEILTSRLEISRRLCSDAECVSQSHSISFHCSVIIQFAIAFWSYYFTCFSVELEDIFRFPRKFSNPEICTVSTSELEEDSPLSPPPQVRQRRDHRSGAFRLLLGNRTELPLIMRNSSMPSGELDPIDAAV